MTKEQFIQYYNESKYPNSIFLDYYNENNKKPSLELSTEEFQAHFPLFLRTTGIDPVEVLHNRIIPYYINKYEIIITSLLDKNETCLYTKIKQ
jgi:hypothetical protein